MIDKNLPDVAQEIRPSTLAPIDWVGMASIELPILLNKEGSVYHIPAKADAKVSLDKKASRGIHMSRLYLVVQDELTQNNLNLDLLGKATDSFLKTHEELSTKAHLQIRFEAPLSRKALKSAHSAWRSYPVVMSCLNEMGQKKYYVEVTITYSSTCPASAALARQLIQDKFAQDFKGDTKTSAVEYEKVFEWLGTNQGIVATPHAQRSFARVKAEVEVDFDFVKLIDAVEDFLQTPVQGAVKREDEQEFALRNGQNLMFCEDAARRVKAGLEKITGVKDFIAEFDHVESLHPHSAVSRISKGQQLKDF